MNKLIKCPRCNYEVNIIRTTNWDNLETYLFPLCGKCAWTTIEVFDNECQIEQYIEQIKMKF